MNRIRILIWSLVVIVFASGSLHAQETATPAINKRASQESVRPGINDTFLKADLDINEWLGRFEIESREVFGKLVLEP